MAARNRRDLWRAVWDRSVADGTLAFVLILLACILAVGAFLPQVATRDVIARARAVSSLVSRHGRWAVFLERAGLLNVSESIGARVLVALASCCLLLRIAERVDRLRSRDERLPENLPANLTAGAGLWRSVRALESLELATHAGAVALIIGLAVTQVWGWEATVTTRRGAGPVAIPGHRGWVAVGDTDQVSMARGLERLGLDYGLGFAARARTSDGDILLLQTSPGAAAETELALEIAEDLEARPGDALFAIPAADLIVRVTRAAGPYAEATEELLVQAYRSPSGELAAEATVREGASVPIGEVTIDIQAHRFATITVGYIPGRWPALVGAATVVIGLIGTALHPCSAAIYRRGSSLRTASANEAGDVAVREAS